MTNAAIAAIVWRLARPLLKRAAKSLRDKWAKELKEADDASADRRDPDPE